MRIRHPGEHRRGHGGAVGIRVAVGKVEESMRALSSRNPFPRDGAGRSEWGCRCAMAFWPVAPEVKGT